MSDLARTLYDTVIRYGYLALFVATLLEGTGLPGPIQIALFASGYLIIRGDMDPAAAIMVAAMGNVSGNAIGYLLGANGGRAFVRRWGRYLRITENHLEWIDRWFCRYGSLTAFIARIFGIIRTPVIIGAGVARMPIGPFLLFSCIGDLIWAAFWIYASMLLGGRLFG